MTTIEDKLTYIDGSTANGRLVVGWKPFTIGNVNAAGGELEWDIVDGVVSISLYSNAGALPFGAYYIAKYELENGAVYQEQWVVPNLPVVTLGQVRVSFPPSPSVMISPLQLTSLNAQPGMFLQWDGQRWVPAYPSTFNLNPNWIIISTDKVGSDVNVVGSPVSIGNSVTINIPDAGPTARGVVTIGAQSIAGPKTFLHTATIAQSLRFVPSGTGVTYGEVRAMGSGGADTVLLVGGNLQAARVSANDRPFMAADRFLGGVLDLATLGIAVPPTAMMPGNLASPVKAAAAIQLPVLSGVDWAGIGTGMAGTIWLRTGTASEAGFLYLNTAGEVTCRELRMDPYQHLNAVGTEAVRSDATMVMYSSGTAWAGYGVNTVPEIWFRMGPDVGGAYYYFGAGGARFPSLTLGSITVTGDVNLPPGVATISIYTDDTLVLAEAASLKLVTGAGMVLTGSVVGAQAVVTLTAIGGLADPTTTRGDLIVRSLAGPNRLPVGTNGQALVVDLTQPLAVKWAPAIPVTRRVDTGLGLAGGGDLSADLTLSVVADTTVQRINYLYNGAPVGTRPAVNLIPGANVSLSVVDNAGANRIDVSVAAVGGVSGMGDPTTTIGDLIVRGSNVAATPPTRLAIGANTQVLTADSAAPLGVKWATPTAGGVSSVFTRTGAVVAQGGDYTAAQVTFAVSTQGSYADPAWITALAWAKITGTPAFYADPLTTKGDMVVRGASATTRIGVGTNGWVLTADSAQATGVKWAASAGGFADPTTTKGDLIARDASVATRLGVGTDGQILTADSASSLGLKWAAAPAGGGSQTPWTSDINAASFKLYSVGDAAFGNATASIGIAASAIRRYVTIKGSGDMGVLELAHGYGTDGTGTFVGQVCFTDPLQSAADKRVALLNVQTEGSAANNRGGAMLFLTKADGGALVEKARLTAAGRLGIGKTPTAYPLEVQGDVSISGAYRINGVALAAANVGAIPDTLTAKGDVLSKSSGATYARLGIGSDGQVLTADSAQATGLKWAAAGAASQTPWTSDINAAGNQLNNLGAVVITGTFDPGNVANSLGLDVDLTGYGRIIAWGPNASTNAGIRFITLHSDGSGALEPMRITPAGSVGINQSSPTAKLHVVAPNGVVPLIIEQNESFTTVFSAPSIILKNQNVTVGSGVGISAMNAGGGITSEIRFFNAPGAGAYPNNGGSIAFSTYDGAGSAGTERMRITAAGLVAIGTADASAYRLRVRAGTDISLGVQAGVLVPGAIVLTGINDAVNANIPIEIRATDTIFVGNGVERMRITAEGNVGIGTTSPQVLLHLNRDPAGINAVGSAILLNRANSAIYGAGIWASYNGAGMDMLQMGVGTSYNSTSNPIITIVAANPSSPGGNVGIGLISPSFLLHLYGPSVEPSLTTNSGQFAFHNSGGLQLTMGTNGSGGWLQSKYSGSDGRAFLLMLNPLGGNVGIAEASPLQALHVTGTGIALSGSRQVNYWRIVPSTDQTSTSIGYWVAGSWYPSGVAGLTLQFDGAVGIKKAAPGYSLDVVGDINCTGVHRVNGVAIGGGGITVQNDLSASGRSINVVYQNTTGKAMFVLVTIIIPSGGGGINAMVGATSNPTTQVALQGTSVVNGNVSAGWWVMPGYYYKAYYFGGPPTLSTWTEWY